MPHALDISPTSPTMTYLEKLEKLSQNYCDLTYGDENPITIKIECTCTVFLPDGNSIKSISDNEGHAKLLALLKVIDFVNKTNRESIRKV